MRERFVIREIEGFLSIGSTGALPGLSVHVLDRAFNYRIVATFRTENYHVSCERGRGHVRRLAEKRRDALESARA